MLVGMGGASGPVRCGIVCGLVVGIVCPLVVAKPGPVKSVIGSMLGLKRLVPSGVVFAPVVLGWLFAILLYLFPPMCCYQLFCLDSACPRWSSVWKCVVVFLLECVLFGNLSPCGLS
jgi:hypothetical protein